MVQHIVARVDVQLTILDQQTQGTKSRSESKAGWRAPAPLPVIQRRQNRDAIYMHSFVRLAQHAVAASGSCQVDDHRTRLHPVDRVFA
jgi:hypothetical protein